MMSSKCLLLLSAILCVAAEDELTFKNVMVRCESEDLTANEEITFATIVTGNQLRSHLPPDQECFRIEIDHSVLPVLHGGSFANIRRVHYLLLENNNIREIRRGAFPDLNVLEGMSLKHNRLTEIKDGVFNNVSVPALYLSWNRIVTVHPRAFDDMPTLEVLHLDHNHLVYVNSNWFNNAPKLYRLVLSHNRIERLPRNAFKNLKSKNLVIDLSHNWISAIGWEEFRKPIRYGQLLLGNNRIQSLDGDWLRGVEVRMLDVSNNSLRCLSRGGLAGPDSTNFIGGNPWNCSCLWDIKRKEVGGIFGVVVADREFRGCNIS